MRGTRRWAMTRRSSMQVILDRSGTRTLQKGVAQGADRTAPNGRHLPAAGPSKLFVRAATNFQGGGRAGALEGQEFQRNWLLALIWKALIAIKVKARSHARTLAAYGSCPASTAASTTSGSASGPRQSMKRMRPPRLAAYMALSAWRES